MIQKLNDFRLILMLLILASASSSSKLMAGDGILDGLSVGTKSYLSYETRIDENDGLTDGSFKVKRSYLTVKKSVNDYMSFRMTLDAHQDDEGDMKVRLKYVYALFNLPEFWIFTKPNVEFGLVHMPWLDFEEHINYYRMQGYMFMERSGLFNSADFGFTVGGYFGGEMDDDYKKKVNKKYAGKYGSFAFGAYNGGGYHAIEANDNKTVQARVTIRPLHELIPGLQLSYFGIYGNSNMFIDTIPGFESPDWQNNAFMLSYENQWVTLTGQYVMGKGNQKGKFIDDDFKSTELEGFSVFGEGKLDNNWRLIARYDDFNATKDIEKNKMSSFIAGVAYDFGNHNVLILDFDKTMYNDDKKADKDLIKLTMEVNF